MIHGTKTLGEERISEHDTRTNLNVLTLNCRADALCRFPKIMVCGSIPSLWEYLARLIMSEQW